MAKSEVVVPAFSRRDVVLRELDEPVSEWRKMRTNCVYSQADDGPITLEIGVHATDAQLERASSRFNVPLYALVNFRAMLNLRLANLARRH